MNDEGTPVPREDDGNMKKGKPPYVSQDGITVARPPEVAPTDKQLAREQALAVYAEKAKNAPPPGQHESFDYALKPQADKAAEEYRKAKASIKEEVKDTELPAVDMQALQQAVGSGQPKVMNNELVDRLIALENTMRNLMLPKYESTPDRLQQFMDPRPHAYAQPTAVRQEIPLLPTIVELIEELTHLTNDLHSAFSAAYLITGQEPFKIAMPAIGASNDTPANTLVLVLRHMQELRQWARDEGSKLHKALQG
jgi:hypothetical protein